MKDVSGVRTAQDLERKYDFSSIGKLNKNYELQKETLTKVENELSDFVVETTRSIEDLQDQVDGNITTWFSSGAPTLNNYPANEWTTTEEKNNHLGDLYYDSQTGYGYRFSLDNNVYSWITIKDTDVTRALALANAAQDTADSKRRVFVTQPSPPYDVGDLWINNQELYRCQTTKDENQSYESNDWIIATKYTDDTVANQVGNNLTILSGTVTEIRDDVDDLTTTMTNTTYIVNEQGQTIGTLQTKTSQIEQTVDNISNTIDHDLTVARVKTGTGSLTLQNAHKGELHKLSIKGQISLLFPQSESNLYGYPLVPSDTLTPSNTLTPSSPVPYGNEVLYPSSNLFSKSRILLIDDVEYELDFDFLNYINNDVCDEFVYEDGKCYIIWRVGIDSQGNKYALDNEVIEYRKDVTLFVDTSSVIRLKSFDNVYYESEYLLENKYTDTFATNVRLNSTIEQTAEQISSKVSKNDLISEINQSADTIILKSNRLVIDTDKFKLDGEGNMQCRDAMITGGEILLKSTESNIKFIIQDTNNEECIWKQNARGIDWYGANGGHLRVLNTLTFPVFMLSDSYTGANLNFGGQGLFTINDGANDVIKMNSSGNITCVSLTQTSKAEMKKNIVPFNNGLDIVKNTDIYEYNMIKENDEDKKHIGFVIGDNYNYSEKITSKDNDGAEIYSMTSVLWQAVKEQQEIIDDLKQRIEVLERRGN